MEKSLILLTTQRKKKMADEKTAEVLGKNKRWPVTYA